MKRKNLLVLAMIVTLFSVSCSQEDDIKYSCDETVDSWVKRNLPEIRSMSREQWKELDPDLGLAAYRAFTPEQRIEFWKEKFAEVKALPWSEDELLHIQQAEDFTFSSNILSLDRKLTDKENDELEIFFYKWAKYAEEQLGWEPQLTYTIIASGYSLSDDKTGPNLNHTYFSKGLISATKENMGKCGCKLGAFFSCLFAGSQSCISVNCEETSIGCGFLLSQACDGECLLEPAK